MTDAKLPRLIGDFERHLGTIPYDDRPSPLTLLRSMNEDYFSNTIAWLLDPQGNHGLGVAFLKAFLAKVADERSRTNNYDRTAISLKSVGAGPGRAAGALSVRNAAVLREFHLSRSNRCGGPKKRFCDVVVFDLDRADSFMVVLENKLFGEAAAADLDEYRNIVSSKYGQVQTREFVYLTLSRGEPNTKGQSAGSQATRQWIRLSWITDVGPLIDEALQQTGIAPDRDIASFKRILGWLGNLSDVSRLDPQKREAMRSWLIRQSAECLREELNRLARKGTGEWSVAAVTARQAVLDHSALRSRRVYVTLTPRLSVEIRGRTSSEFAKIIVPFGAYPRQVFNLIDMAAYELYDHLFRTPSERRAGRRLSKPTGEIKNDSERLFRSLHTNTAAFRVMLLPGLVEDPGEDVEATDALAPEQQQAAAAPPESIAAIAEANADSETQLEKAHDEEPVA